MSIGGTFKSLKKNALPTVIQNVLDDKKLKANDVIERITNMKTPNNDDEFNVEIKKMRLVGSRQEKDVEKTVENILNLLKKEINAVLR